MSVDHYENFPVASFVLPRALRPPVIAIYRFARHADDLADEGEARPAERLAALAQYRAALKQVLSGENVGDPILAALAATQRQWQLPTDPFFDLLDAFTQDVTKSRYSSSEELFDYCRRSANPVGRLLLHLYRVTDEESLRQSDSICTALQLINFWQDVAIDFAKGRVYLPLDECARFGVDADAIGPNQVGENWQALMHFQFRRSHGLLAAGASLCSRLPGRLGFELKLVVQGGLRILAKLEMLRGNVFARRPALDPWDWCHVFARALVQKRDWGTPNSDRATL